MPAQDLPQHIQRIVRTDDRGKLAFDIGQIAHHDGHNDRILGWKVAVKVPDAHPGGTGKVLHRGTIEAFFDEGRPDRIQNARLPRI